MHSNIIIKQHLCYLKGKKNVVVVVVFATLLKPSRFSTLLSILQSSLYGIFHYLYSKGEKEKRKEIPQDQ